MIKELIEIKKAVKKISETKNEVAVKVPVLDYMLYHILEALGKGSGNYQTIRLAVSKYSKNFEEPEQFFRAALCKAFNHQFIVTKMNPHATSVEELRETTSISITLNGNSERSVLARKNLRPYKVERIQYETGKTTKGVKQEESKRTLSTKGVVGRSRKGRRLFTPSRA